MKQVLHSSTYMLKWTTQKFLPLVYDAELGFGDFIYSQNIAWVLATSQAKGGQKHVMST